MLRYSLRSRRRKGSRSLILMPSPVGVNRIEPLAGDEKATTGGVLSKLIVIDAVAVTPIVLTVVPEITWFVPSVLTTIGDGQAAIPNAGSEQAKVTMTSAPYQSAWFAGLSEVAVIVGPCRTLNPFARETTSAPVLTVTVRDPTAAFRAIVSCAVRCVGSIATTLPIVTSGPRSMMLPLVKCVNCPEMVTGMLACPCPPKLGLIESNVAMVVPVILRIRKLFGLLLSSTLRLILSCAKLTSLTMVATCWLNSFSLTTSTPFKYMLAALIRAVPSGLPF